MVQLNFISLFFIFTDNEYICMTVSGKHVPWFAALLMHTSILNRKTKGRNIFKQSTICLLYLKNTLRKCQIMKLFHFENMTQTRRFLDIENRDAWFMSFAFNWMWRNNFYFLGSEITQSLKSRNPQLSCIIFMESEEIMGRNFSKVKEV